MEDFTPRFRVSPVAEIPPAARAEAVTQFQRLCEDYLTLEALLRMPLPRRYPEPYSIGGLSPLAAGEEVAAAERSRLHLGQDPIRDLPAVLEADVGLRVFVSPLSEARIAGMFVCTEPLGGCILANGLHPPTRQTWSVAHEYGHFLTDRYPGEVTVLDGYDRKPRSEQFADCFAASFLMPAMGMRRRFRAIVHSRGGFTVADLCLLAHEYGVSIEAMTYRLERLRCVGRATWARLSAKGFEPGPAWERLGIPVEQGQRLRLPPRYQRLAVEAFEREMISEGELARYLRCTRVEAREAVESLTRSAEIGPAGSTGQLALDFGERLEVAAAERE